MDWKTAIARLNAGHGSASFSSSGGTTLESAFGVNSAFAKKSVQQYDALGNPISSDDLNLVTIRPEEQPLATGWTAPPAAFSVPPTLTVSDTGYGAAIAPLASWVNTAHADRTGPVSVFVSTPAFSTQGYRPKFQGYPYPFLQPQAQTQAEQSQSAFRNPSPHTITISADLSNLRTAVSEMNTDPSHSFNKPATTGGGLFGSTTTTPAATTGTGGFGFGQQQQQPQPQQQQQQQQPASGGMFGSFGQQNQANASAANNATSGGLFGQQQQKPATGGLFGQQQSTTTPATGGLFGQQTQQNASQPAAGGLFGAASQQKPAGGLFGSTTQQPAQSGGLFGSTTQQPAQSGGLFGSTTQQPAQSGGLFGSTTQQKPAGGLFGSTTQQPAQSGGLFGSTTQQQPAQGGLFGSTQQQQPAQGGLFASKPAGGLLNSTSFQQQQPASSGLGKNTKFSELPENVQKGIEQMDAFFKDQRHIGQVIDAEPIGRAIWQTSADIKVAQDEAAAIAQGLEALKHSLERLAAKVQAQAEDLQRLLETWEAAKPADARHPGVRPVAHRDFPQAFFARVADEEAERVQRYKRNIRLLSRAVASLGRDTESMTPQVVVQTIQNNQGAILALAAQLEGLETRMNTLRAGFTDEYREHTNSMRDPFQVAREEKGLPLLTA